jgi:hypothetical protein
MNERERLQRLEEAVRAAVADRGPTPAEERLAAQAAAAKRSTGLVVMLLLVWVALGFVWITRPAWVFGPKPRAAAAPAVEEAEVRYALYLMRARVDAYVRQQGRAPSSLQHVGRVERGVTLRGTTGGYVLEGRRGATLLQLTSTMNADSFLGGSLDLLQRQRP